MQRKTGAKAEDRREKLHGRLFQIARSNACTVEQGDRRRPAVATAAPSLNSALKSFQAACGFQGMFKPVFVTVETSAEAHFPKVLNYFKQFQQYDI